MFSLKFTFEEWRVILIFAAAVGFGMADSQSIAPLIPEIDHAFGFHQQESIFLLAAYFLGAALSAAVAGPGSDVWGRRVFFVGGVAIAAVADLGCYFAQSFWLLALLRFFVGMGIGTCALTYLAYMGDLFPYERRGLAMGLVSVGFFAGMTFGPLAATAIAERYGWRAIFVALSSGSAVTFAVAFFTLPKLKKQRGHKGGLRGLWNEWVSFHTQTGTLLVLLAFSAQAASAFAFNALVGDWLNEVYHFDPTERSLVFIYLGVGTLVASPAAGYLADRFGKISTAYYSSWAIACGLLVIPFIPSLPGPFGLGATILYVAGLVGIFFGIRTTPFLALITQVVPDRQRGNFLALKSVWTYVGIAVGTLIGRGLYSKAASLMPQKVWDVAHDLVVRHIEPAASATGAGPDQVVASFIGFIALGVFAGAASIFTATLLGRLSKLGDAEKPELAEETA